MKILLDHCLLENTIFWDTTICSFFWRKAFVPLFHVQPWHPNHFLVLSPPTLWCRATNKVGEDPSNKRYPCIHCTCNGCTQEYSFFGVCCYFKSEHSGNMDYLQAVVIFNCFRSSNLEKMPLLLPRYGWEGDGKFWDFSFWFLFFFLTFISLIFLTLPLQMKKRSRRNYIELFLFLCQT